MLKNSERLNGVHPNMVKVVTLAATKLPFDLCIVEGLRTLERQKQLYAQGRTMPGKVVTWTMNSKHLKQGDGWGHANDLAPIIKGALNWDPPKFTLIAEAMFEASKELSIPIRWGADWNHNGRPHEKGETDSPHFELA